MYRAPLVIEMLPGKKVCIDAPLSEASTVPGFIDGGQAISFDNGQTNS